MNKDLTEAEKLSLANRLLYYNGRGKDAISSTSSQDMGPYKLSDVRSWIRAYGLCEGCTDEEIRSRYASVLVREYGPESSNLYQGDDVDFALENYIQKLEDNDLIKEKSDIYRIISLDRDLTEEQKNVLINRLLYYNGHSGSSFISVEMGPYAVDDVRAWAEVVPKNRTVC